LPDRLQVPVKHIVSPSIAGFGVMEILIEMLGDGKK